MLNSFQVPFISADTRGWVTRRRFAAFVGLLGTLAGEKQARSAQITVAWLLANEPWIVPTPGTTMLHGLEENVGAVTIELSSEDLGWIGEALTHIKTQRDCYPAVLAARTAR